MSNGLESTTSLVDGSKPPLVWPSVVLPPNVLKPKGLPTPDDIETSIYWVRGLILNYISNGELQEDPALGKSLLRIERTFTEIQGIADKKRPLPFDISVFENFKNYVPLAIKHWINHFLSTLMVLVVTPSQRRTTTVRAISAPKTIQDFVDRLIEWARNASGLLREQPPPLTMEEIIDFVEAYKFFVIAWRITIEAEPQKMAEGDEYAKLSNLQIGTLNRDISWKHVVLILGIIAIVAVA
ncbi:hypothetical protein IFM53868_10382 [Aspergillus udagawae]|uniref:Uncharacterized protein n=1 Tax=Aspergillus udagawae TaxID=91492 RepID=A0ABQ1BE23_9EURO|nr:hypothetical protein IFM53868_10382 [Aspergillus udagawae]